MASEIDRFFGGWSDDPRTTDSTKLFYIVGSLYLLSIITLAIEIAFYVYFKWIV